MSSPSFGDSAAVTTEASGREECNATAGYDPPHLERRELQSVNFLSEQRFFIDADEVTLIPEAIRNVWCEEIG